MKKGGHGREWEREGAAGAATRKGEEDARGEGGLAVGGLGPWRLVSPGRGHMKRRQGGSKSL